jgi:hypothetical protein
MYGRESADIATITYHMKSQMFRASAMVLIFLNGVRILIRVLEPTGTSPVKINKREKNV